MSKFRDLVESETNYYFGPEKTKYMIVYTAGWSGPWGDDKEVEELKAGNDLDQAKEKAKSLSAKLNKIVDLMEVNETGEYIPVVRYVDGIEREL